MLIDCELMGSERRLELCVPDVEQAWSFYRDIMGAQEVFRSEPHTGDPSRIGFIIGKTGFTITSEDHAHRRRSPRMLRQGLRQAGKEWAGRHPTQRDPLT